MTIKNEDSSLDYEKSEEPAKMTHSISDFQEQESRILASIREHLTKNPDPDLESCKSIFLYFLTKRLAPSPARIAGTRRDFCGLRRGRT